MDEERKNGAGERPAEDQHEAGERPAEDQPKNAGWSDDAEMHSLNEYKDYDGNSDKYMPRELLEEKNIVLCVIFSIISFGIYYVYWFYTLSKKIQLLNHEEPSCVGEVLLYFLIPFYCLYWMYTRARTTMEASRKYWHYNRVSDEGVAYLLLALFGLGIVAVALMQNDFNKFARDMSELRGNN